MWNTLVLKFGIPVRIQGIHNARFEVSTPVMIKYSKTFNTTFNTTLHSQASNKVQSLQNLRQGCVSRNFTQIEFNVSRIFPKFNSGFLAHALGKLQKYASKCTIKRLRQRLLRIFTVLVGFSSYFLRGAKYVTIFFFFIFYFRLANENLRQDELSGSYCNLSEHACSMLTIYKSDTRMLLCRQTVRRIKIDGQRNPSSMDSNLLYDRNCAVKDLPAMCSARCSEKACPVAPFAQLIKIYIISFELDFFCLCRDAIKNVYPSPSLKLFLCNCVSMSVLKLFLLPSVKMEEIAGFRCL